MVCDHSFGTASCAYNAGPLRRCSASKMIGIRLFISDGTRSHEAIDQVWHEYQIMHMGRTANANPLDWPCQKNSRNAMVFLMPLRFRAFFAASILALTTLCAAQPLETVDMVFRKQTSMKNEAEPHGGEVVHQFGKVRS